MNVNQEERDFNGNYLEEVKDNNEQNRQYPNNNNIEYENVENVNKINKPQLLIAL